MGRYTSEELAVNAYLLACSAIERGEEVPVNAPGRQLRKTAARQSKQPGVSWRQTTSIWTADVGAINEDGQITRIRLGSFGPDEENDAIEAVKKVRKQIEAGQPFTNSTGVQFVALNPGKTKVAKPRVVELARKGMMQKRPYTRRNTRKLKKQKQTTLKLTNKN